MAMEVRKFQCNLEGLAAAQSFLESVCASPKPAIVLDELASNIVRCSGASDFSLGLEMVDGTLTLVLSDGGVAFDPTCETKKPDIAQPAQEREIGGLGVFMVKKMSESMTYRREAGKNILTVVLNCSSVR